MSRPLPRPQPHTLFRPLTALICACALLPAAAFAEGDPNPTPEAAAAPAEAPGVIYQPVTEHIFDGEDVEGRTKNPDGDWVEGRPGARLTSLIHIRTSFRAELLQTAQDL